MSYHFTELDHINILTLREQILSCKEIGDFIGRSEDRVKRFLTKAGLTTATSYRFGKGRKFFINSSFWEQPSEELYYFLGLFLADGCITSGGGQKRYIGIGLHDQDKSILEHLTKIIQPTKKLYEYKRPDNHHWTLRINSEEFINFIEEFVGSCKNKTYEITWPSNKIPVNMLRHFIRGFIDGDGCFYLNRNLDRYSLSAVGNIYVMTEFKQLLKNKFNLKANLSKCQNPHFQRFATKSKKIIEIGDWLYDNCNIFISRKRDKFEEIKEYILSKPKRIYG